MIWAHVKLIFLRELRDQLRDRRTLAMMLLMPILLYPALGIGMVEFTQRFTEQPRLVVVRGIGSLPEWPPLIVGDRFFAGLFDVAEEADQLQIVREPNPDQKLKNGEIQLILDVPPDTREAIESGRAVRWQPHYNSADEKSRIAYLRLKEALENWNRLILRERIAAKQLPEEFASPSVVESSGDIATPQQVAGGMIWGKLFPFLLVVMSLTGAFYPAVDLCAGEKERGTMETLLISPAGRPEIVIGKYLTVCIFSMGTAIMNLASMALTGWVVARQMAGALPTRATVAVLTPPQLEAAFWMMLVLVPLSALFSAMAIALSMFARSTKEGQYYLTPLFMVTMPLVLVTVMPGIELNTVNSVVPVSGAALLLRTLIQGQYGLALQFFVPVLLPTMLYAALALRWAIDQFGREEVLFREAERLDLWLWAKHLFREKEPLPTAAESMFCYAVMLLLVWYFGSFLGASSSEDQAERRWAMQRALVVLQIAIVAAPSLIMAVMLTSKPLATLIIRRPARWWLVPLVAVLALMLHPIVVEAGHQIHRGYPAPKWIEEHLSQIVNPSQPILWQLFLVALLPAVCEEIAFRGFLLSGLLRGMSAPVAIILSGFLFGFFHMNPQQLLPTTALGVILGVIATRTGSLLPCMLFHFLNNAFAVLMANFQSYVAEGVLRGGDSVPAWAVSMFDRLYRQPYPGASAPQVPYQLGVLVIAALATTAILTWLLKQPIRTPAAASEFRSHGELDAPRFAAAAGSST